MKMYHHSLLALALQEVLEGLEAPIGKKKILIQKAGGNRGVFTQDLTFILTKKVPAVL